MLTTESTLLATILRQQTNGNIFDTNANANSLALAYKRKAEQHQQQQQQQRKQHRAVIMGLEIGNKDSSSCKQQVKMFYNSKARTAAIFASKYTINTTTTTTISDNEQNNNFFSAKNEATTTTTTTTTTYNTTLNNNSNNNANGNNKRCLPKFHNGNLAAMTAAQNQQQQTQTHQPNSNNNNNKNATRKNRYNNNHNNKRQQDANYNGQQQQKRNHATCGNVNGGDAAAHSAATGAAATNNWLGRNYGRRFESSCVEDKFLGQHNPGHRNSTSSETTDINSSNEHLNKTKSSKAKKRAKRQQQQQQQLQKQQATLVFKQQSGKAANKVQDLEFQEQEQMPAAAAAAGNNKKKQQQQQQQKTNQLAATRCTGKRQYNNNTNTNTNKGNHNNNHNHNTGTHNRRNNYYQNQQNNNNSNNHNGRNKQQQQQLCSKICDSAIDTASSALSSFNTTPNSTPPSKLQQYQSYKNYHSYKQQGSPIYAPSFATRKQLLQSHQQPHNPNFKVGPLLQYSIMHMDDTLLIQQLRRYVIDHHLLRVYGYPVESVVHEGAIEIFKCLPHMTFAAAHGMASCAETMTIINYHDGLNTSKFQYSRQELGGGVLPHIMETAGGTNSGSSSSSSGGNRSTDSGNISPRSLDSETGSEWSECGDTARNANSYALVHDGGYELYCNYAETSLAKQCTRCKRDFLVDEQNGQYLTREECIYHWGKFQRYFDGTASTGRWTCCQASEEHEGCSKHDVHVWNGSVVGVNGPFLDFVRTRKCADVPAVPQVYALDCEMSYTGRGLDVTKVSLVSLNGQLVYEHFVRPDADIVDYNTRFSGITARNMKGQNVKSLAEVQRDLLQLIDADTILVGHGLDNDLRALRLVHNTLIDTSIAFPHASGFPYRRALRQLTKTHLKRDIQTGDGTTGHSSFEDSRACMELMLWRVQQELNGDFVEDYSS